MLGVTASLPPDGSQRPRRFAAADYVELTVHFKCNLKCEHCMIEGTMDWLKPESIDQFEGILAQNAQERRWKGLILTGSEVTLRRDLPELARMAREQRLRARAHPDPRHAPGGAGLLQ